MKTDWNGIHDDLLRVSNPALVITVTDDVVVPSD
jgi:hypothetical protein